MRKPKIVPALGAVLFGGAFLITMAGSAFYAIEPFCKDLDFGETAYAQAVQGFSAVCCAYVMWFSRGTKLYYRFQNLLAKQKPIHETKSTPLLIASTDVVLQTNYGKIMLALGILAGIPRSVLLGYISTLTLGDEMAISNDTELNILAGYVCFSNTLVYIDFTVFKAQENIDYVVNLNRGNIPSANQVKPSRKWFVSMIGLLATISTYGYFNLSIAGAINKTPYIKELRPLGKKLLGIPTNAISVTVGNVSKAIQLYRYGTGKEVLKYPKRQLDQVSSIKIKSHKTFGAGYVITYFITALMGLLALTDTWGWDRRASIAPLIIFAAMGTLLEYVFSVRNMIYEEQARILDQQKMSLLANDYHEPEPRKGSVQFSDTVEKPRLLCC